MKTHTIEVRSTEWQRVIQERNEARLALRKLRSANRRKAKRAAAPPKPKPWFAPLQTLWKKQTARLRALFQR